jgi:LAO/AO transport system kinase
VTRDIDDLVAEALAGVESSLGRLLTMVETDESGVSHILAGIAAARGGAFRIGVTGPPGSGKSTLIDRLVGIVRSEGLTVGVICVDPSSPVSGGAVLGDRIRMERHFSDEGVFIRSMASRGDRGGIAKAVGGAVALFDACGKDVVIVETVGTGQEGIEVTGLVDVTVLVLAPGWGDTVQLMKAGILEVADVVVVNKADLGSAGLIEGIKDVLALGRRDRRQPVVETQAIDDIGVDVLWAELQSFETDRGRVRGRVQA